MKLTFLGGSGTVTGSKHLLTFGDKHVLIDCGLFQGVKEQRLLNWKQLPVDVSAIDSVILTHAHLDHCGYLPLLLQQGFRGRILCSEPTAELTKVVLLDAAKIEEEDADHANTHGYSKHEPALPLFTVEDAKSVCERLQVLPIDQWHPIAQGRAKVRLSPSGHIVGSTFVEVKIGDRIVVFSGDLGRENPITLHSRRTLDRADVLVIESTYGDRQHPAEDPMSRLCEIITHTVLRSGSVIIPAFAIGRTQDILFLIASLKAEKRIPNIPVYLDSPMAERANNIFDRFPGWHKLSPMNLKRLSNSCHHVSSPEQSKFLCKSKEPSIIIAGSGMLTGGRIRQHLMTRLPDARNTVVLVGYQAAGTLGRFLQEGASEAKIYGQYIPVRAKITSISSLSAHADQREILDWISAFRHKPKQIFIVHGEEHAAEGLRVRISDQFGIVPHIAKLNESVEIDVYTSDEQKSLSK